MHDAAIVRVGETARNLQDDVDALRQRQRLLLVDDVREIDAVGVFENDVRHPVLFTEVEHRNDIRMMQSSRRSRFGEQSIHMLVREDRLDGDVAIDDRIARFVDNAHPASSENRDDLILPEALRVSLRRGHGTRRF